MENRTSKAVATVAAVPQKSMGQRFLEWVEEPFGQIVAASVATIGSFGFVLSGIWFVNTMVN